MKGVKCSRGVEKIYEPAILLVISRKPNYGYKIKEVLEKEYSCKVNFGNLYRCLNNFVKKGFVEKQKEKSPKGPERVVYKITARGRAYLKAWKKELVAQSKIIDKIVKNFEKLNL